MWRSEHVIARARLTSRRTWRTSRETPSVRQPPRPLRSNGVVWTVAVANSPALTVQSWTVALGESGGAGEQSATPIAQQLSSTTSFHVVPADCSGRRWLHQSIIIFACAASRCLESAVIVYRSHLRRSGTLDLRFKMIIFKSCPIGPDRLHTACSCALCRARISKGGGGAKLADRLRAPLTGAAHVSVTLSTCATCAGS